MQSAPLHPKEEDRLRSLYSLQILDTISEEEYNHITKLASVICDVPISLVTFVDQDRQWFKSKIGLSVEETPREIAFCAHTILEEDSIFEIKNAREDERFFDNPLVTGDLNVSFYAGVSIKDNEDLPLGTLCVVDRKPRTLSEEQKSALKSLGKQVEQLLSTRRLNFELQDANQKLKEQNDFLEKFSVIAAHDIRGPLANIEMLVGYMLNHEKESFKPETRKIMSLIKDSTTNLRELVLDMLEYYKADKWLEDEKKLVAVDSLLDSIAGLVPGGLVIEKDLTITELVVPETPLKQIFLNILLNAQKHGGKSDIKVSVKSYFHKGYVVFELSNNGNPISPNIKSIIEKLFKSKDNSSFGLTNGLGLGFHIVKKLIDRLKGCIKMSDSDEGTTFYVYLPLTEGQAITY